MDHFIEIKILPDPEFNSPMLMGALFNKFHRILAELNSSNIGVSFPGFNNKSIGGILRLHGGKSALEGLMESSWLRGMGDHIQKTPIRPIPGETRFVRVKRKQNKYSNMARLRRRYMKRHQASEQQAIKALPDSLEKMSSYPFIRIKSKSTGQDCFPLFIEQKVVDGGQSTGSFNSYGLSNTAALPFF